MDGGGGAGSCWRIATPAGVERPAWAQSGRAARSPHADSAKLVICAGIGCRIASEAPTTTVVLHVIEGSRDDPAAEQLETVLFEPVWGDRDRLWDVAG